MPARDGYDRHVRLEKLPGWVVDDVTSVRNEVAEWRDLTPTQRWELARGCARTAMWALRIGGHAAQALAYEEPLPDSTVRALERLRRQAGWPRGG